jgi:hypothetical protein
MLINEYKDCELKISQLVGFVCVLEGCISIDINRQNSLIYDV